MYQTRVVRVKKYPKSQEGKGRGAWLCGPSRKVVIRLPVVLVTMLKLGAKRRSWNGA